MNLRFGTLRTSESLLRDSTSLGDLESNRTEKGQPGENIARGPLPRG